MEDIIRILITVLGYTNGWAVVTVFVPYIGFRVYQVYTADRALRIIEKEFLSFRKEQASLLKSINNNVSMLADRISDFISRGKE